METAWWRLLSLGVVFYSVRDPIWITGMYKFKVFTVTVTPSGSQVCTSSRFLQCPWPHLDHRYVKVQGFYSVRDPIWITGMYKFKVFTVSVTPSGSQVCTSSRLSQCAWPHLDHRYVQVQGFYSVRDPIWITGMYKFKVFTVSVTPSGSQVCTSSRLSQCAWPHLDHRYVQVQGFYSVRDPIWITGMYKFKVSTVSVTPSGSQVCTSSRFLQCPWPHLDHRYVKVQGFYSVRDPIWITGMYKFKVFTVTVTPSGSQVCTSSRFLQCPWPHLDHRYVQVLGYHSVRDPIWITGM